MKPHKTKSRAAGTGRPWKNNDDEQNFSANLRRDVNPNHPRRGRRGFLRTRLK